MKDPPAKDWRDPALPVRSRRPKDR